MGTLGWTERPVGGESPIIECPGIECRGVRKSYGRGPTARRILDGIDWRIDAGAWAALVGASGSGKSTLARCLALLEPVDEGEILVAGCPRDNPRIQLIFQDPSRALDPYFTVERAIAQPLVIRGWGTAAERRARVREAMAEVDLPAAAAARRVSEVSGGQKRRVLIARALMAEPRVLILDESLSGLDPTLRARMVNLLLDIQRRRGLTCVLISHDMRLALHLADTVAVMADGRIVERGTPAELRQRPGHGATRALLAAAGIAVADVAGAGTAGPETAGSGTVA